jgi:hypothetical protein
VTVLNGKLSFGGIGEMEKRARQLEEEENAIRKEEMAIRREIIPYSELGHRDLHVACSHRVVTTSIPSSSELFS